MRAADYSTDENASDVYSTDAVVTHRPRKVAKVEKTEVAQDTHAKTVEHNTHTEVPAGEHHEERLIDSPETWVAIAFLLFLVVALKFVFPPITKGLDNRAAKIREQLEQASKLKAEAEALLAQYKAEQASKLKEAESILAAAQADATALRDRAAEDLKQYIARRAAQAEEKIARAEADAIATLRRQMIDAATNAARATLVKTVTSEAKDPALARAIESVAEQLSNRDDNAPAKPKRKRA